MEYICGNVVIGFCYSKLPGTFSMLFECYLECISIAGVPICEEEGRGYFLVEGYRLPPVMFTREEARAMVTTSKILNYHTEDSLKKNTNLHF